MTQDRKKTHHWKKTSEPQCFSLSSASNAVLQYLFPQFWQASVDESNCLCNAGMNQSIDRIQLWCGIVRHGNTCWVFVQGHQEFSSTKDKRSIRCGDNGRTPKYCTDSSDTKRAVTNVLLEKFKLKSKLKFIHSFATLFACSGSHYGAQPSMCRTKSRDAAFKEHSTVCLHNRSLTVTQRQKSSNMNHLLCKEQHSVFSFKINSPPWKQQFPVMELEMLQFPFCGELPQFKTFCLVSTTVIVRHSFNYSCTKI